MADTEFSRQLDAAQARAEELAANPHKIVGRGWFNILLVVILMSIATWVYRSPLNSVFSTATAPLSGHAEQALVDRFGTSLDVMVAAKKEGALHATEQAQAKLVAAQAAAAADSAKETLARASDQVAATTKAVAAVQSHNASSPGATSHNAWNGSATTSSTGGTTHVTTPPVTAPAKAALVAPTNKYFGVALPETPFTMTPVSDFAASVGKSPNLVGGYQTFDNTFQPAIVQRSWSQGALPMITWEPQFANVSDAEQPKLADIASGKYDAYIQSYAAGVASAQLPVAIRFAHEMNGRWYTWSEDRFGNNPGDYVAAWRHVHDVFEAAGATNTIWVWSPNVIGSNPNLPLSQVYPGDAYVDWAALSGYYRTDTGKTPSFSGTFSSSLNAIRNITAKPILLSEIGVGTTVQNRITWLQSLFAAMPANPDVIGFVYFDYDKSAQADAQDWRLDIDPTVLQTFKDGIADPIFGSGPPVANVAEPVPGAPTTTAPAPTDGTQPVTVPTPVTTLPPTTIPPTPVPAPTTTTTRVPATTTTTKKPPSTTTTQKPVVTTTTTQPRKVVAAATKPTTTTTAAPKKKSGWH